MTVMPKRRLPHVHKETNRHGDVVWYYRVGQGPRTRLRETYGTRAFVAEVKAVAAGAPPTPALPRKAGQGSLAWAIGLYRASSAWSNLSAATRKQRGCIFDRIVRSDTGGKPLLGLPRKAILDGLHARSETPAAARHFLQTMRGLFTWALAEELVSVDPTMGVVARAARTEGHPVWNDDDIAAFRARWPLGTRERVAFDVLLHTGLRRGDAVMLGRPHVKAGVIRIKTAKTGEPVAIVICAELAATLAAGPCGDLTFIAGEKGMPRVKASFGEWFRVACHAAGVRKSAHGLRKAAATRDANDGYTEAELEAKYGWRGGRMASHYTRSADRERLSIEAASKRRT